MGEERELVDAPSDQESMHTSDEEDRAFPSENEALVDEPKEVDPPSEDDKYEEYGEKPKEAAPPSRIQAKKADPGREVITPEQSKKDPVRSPTANIEEDLNWKPQKKTFKAKKTKTK